MPRAARGGAKKAAAAKSEDAKGSNGLNGNHKVEKGGKKRKINAEEAEAEPSAKKGRGRISLDKAKAGEQLMLKKLEPDTSMTGVVLTLGQGDTGQLGLGEDIMERSKPALVKDLENVVDICAGGMHSVCLNKDGEVKRCYKLFDKESKLRVSFRSIPLAATMKALWVVKQAMTTNAIRLEKLNFLERSFK